jgi:hypothetical protein
MRGEILPDRCNQCLPSAISDNSTTAPATDISSAIRPV